MTERHAAFIMGKFASLLKLKPFYISTYSLSLDIEKVDQGEKNQCTNGD